MNMSQRKGMMELGDDEREGEQERRKERGKMKSVERNPVRKKEL